MKNYLSFLLLIILSSLTFNVQSQGCSDAGVCTINTLKDNSYGIHFEEIKRNTFKTGISYGVGDFNISYLSPYVEYSNMISKLFSVSGKLTYAFISGELANTNNLGDLVFSGNLNFINKDYRQASLIAGVKIPLTNSNKKEDDIVLPMNYQTSLGTYDIIVGLNYLYYNLGVSVAFQQPVSNASKNEFIQPADENLKEYKYTTTNKFERKGDIMGRVSYNIGFLNKKINIRPSMLAIYHIGNDLYTDEMDFQRQIEGSQGLTLNGNLFLSYQFAHNKLIELSVGAPFITRDARPDGLTRKYVLGLEYIYRF